MQANGRDARIAGLLYFIVVVTGIFSLAYVPSQIEADDAATVMRNIVANEPLFRLGIVSSLVCYTAFLLLPLALYRLLSAQGRPAAVLMVALATASVPFSFANIMHRFDVLTLLGDAGYLRAFSAEQLQAQVMLSLQSYRDGILVSEIFWGLWLLPLGWLVFKSRLLPRVLGVLLMLGCAGYLADFLGRVLVPEYAASGLGGYVRLPASLGEIGTCLWLLVMGARPSGHPANE
jgi:hypothetical protein